ncbi:MAG: cytochrome c family protein [Methanosarcinaceae archaeon]|nr:cytochrome c family protein [Methanosarcinaceae archaeon]
MKRNVNIKIAKILVVFLVIGSIGLASAAIGRFTPTHAIVEPVYCGACHPDQTAELAATTHLAHFAGAVIEAAEEGGAEITQAQAISGGCVMCHNTWANSEKIFVSGYNFTTLPDGESKITMNAIVMKEKASSVVYIEPEAGFARLGTNITGVSADKLLYGTDYTTNETGITLITGANLSAINDSGDLVKVSFKLLDNPTVTFKDVWGDLSGNSPNGGYLQDDISGKPSCGNPEKALCHVTELATGMAAVGGMSEGLNAKARSGTFFQHEMGYTSAEYAAKQVKLCGVCHVNKLPPMTSDGEPIRQDIAEDTVIIRNSHGGGELINTTNGAITMISSDFAHKGVQCIRCHSHAGIGTVNEGTGVQST